MLRSHCVHHARFAGFGAIAQDVGVTRLSPTAGRGRARMSAYRGGPEVTCGMEADANDPKRAFRDMPGRSMYYGWIAQREYPSHEDRWNLSLRRRSIRGADQSR